MAELALQQGWRVLHLQPREASVETESLANALLVGSGKCLLVMDYFDQIQGFDSRYWTHAVLPDANLRGLKISLLGNRRPLQEANYEDNGFFRTVELSVDAHRRALISLNIEETVAPKALALLGTPRMRELCGNRPIIALLIAAELEKLAEKGQLAGIDVGQHPADLVIWIRKRLLSDGLLYGLTPTRAWEDAPRLEPGLVCATAVLAAAPLREAELEKTAKSALSLSGVSGERGSAVVESLKLGGWLEPNEFGQLRTPHDSVADLTLSRLYEAHPDKVFGVVFGAAQAEHPLAPLLAALRLLSLNGWTHSGRFTDQLLGWLSEKAVFIGGSLLRAPSDKAAYSLGALLSHPIMTEAAVAQWDSLVLPWIEQNGTRHEARHLLYRGLKRIGPVPTLYGPALRWLDTYFEHKDARYVLGEALQKIPSEMLDRRGDLLRFALGWLERFPRMPDAEFVIAPLLMWPRQWLGSFESHVLNATIRWIDANVVLLDAQFVFKPLLKWSTDRLAGKEDVILQSSLLWLRTHGPSFEAAYVLDPLLDWRTNVLQVNEGEVLKIALNWLKIYGTRAEAQFVLHPLLTWHPRRLGQSQLEIRNTATHWLTLFGSLPEAEFVIAPLLGWRMSRLDTVRSDIVGIAEAWIAKHPSVDSQFVVEALINYDGLPATRRAYWTKLALLRIGTLQGAVLSFAWRSLLSSVYLQSEGESAQIWAAAISWIEQNKFDRESRYIAARMLATKSMDDALWASVAALGLSCLEESDRLVDDCRLLGEVCCRLHLLDAGMLQKWIEIVHSWITSASRYQDAVNLVNRANASFHGGMPIEVLTALNRAISVRHRHL